jgi:predicted GNAT superfamily acetyltransferase
MTKSMAPAEKTHIAVRPLHAVHEMRIGVELQQRVWGYSAIDTVPEQMFVVAKESGGQVLCAFDNDQPIGFALAYAGIHHGEPYLHSHMVGIVPEFQNRGIGRLLKLAQREDAIARGINLIEWTFDPLQLRNAYFNIVRLGAIVRRFIPNLYGRTSSPLHGALPTDRLVAEWWVNSTRVTQTLNNNIPKADPAARISFPIGIREICSSDPPRAETIQSQLREQFEKHFASGLAAVSVEFDEQEGSYLLEPYED